MACNLSNFSHLVLLVSSILSIHQLVRMCQKGIFTFSLIGLTFIAINCVREVLECVVARRNKLQSPRASPAPNRYRYTSPSSSAASDHYSNDRRGAEEAVAGSLEALVTQFCAEVFATCFFSTDLFYACRSFDGDLVYLPLLAGVVAVAPAACLEGARRRDLLIFLIPANAFGQIYAAGFRESNPYAMAAGYCFFAAYYHLETRRVRLRLQPYAQRNYMLASFCALAPVALTQAFNREMKASRA